GGWARAVVEGFEHGPGAGQGRGQRPSAEGSGAETTDGGAGRRARWPRPVAARRFETTTQEASSVEAAAWNGSSPPDRPSKKPSMPLSMSSASTKTTLSTRSSRSRGAASSAVSEGALPPGSGLG